MIRRSDLEDRVTDVLEKSNFDVLRYHGCFDIAAKRKKILLLKVLVNIDSFQEQQSENLKIVSKSLCAFPLLIGMRTNKEKLKENIIYERFYLTTMNPETLENIFSSFSPKIFRKRGGMFVDIYPERLRLARERRGLTQEELAKKVGTTKKTIYEHEKTEKKMSKEFAIKLEKVLDKNIIKPFALKETVFENIEKKPKTRFETEVFREFRRIGFDANFVEQKPFNIIVKSKKEKMILTKAETQKRCQKIDELKKLSAFFKSLPLLITKEKGLELSVPTLEKTELNEFKSANELMKFLKSF